MPRKVCNVRVQFDLHAVTCPGVWLCPKGQVSLRVSMLDAAADTADLEPAFPLLVHETFTFARSFRRVRHLGDLGQLLAGQLLTIQLIQWGPSLYAGNILSTFETSLEQLLFPMPPRRALIAGVDVDLLMEPTDVFPGILAPKVEVSTRTTIEETLGSSLCDDGITVFPKTIISKTAGTQNKRQRSVCHTRQTRRPGKLPAPSCRVQRPGPRTGAMSAGDGGKHRRVASSGDRSAELTALQRLVWAATSRDISRPSAAAPASLPPACPRCDMSHPVGSPLRESTRRFPVTPADRGEGATMNGCGCGRQKAKESCSKSKITASLGNDTTVISGCICGKPKTNESCSKSKLSEPCSKSGSKTKVTLLDDQHSGCCCSKPPLVESFGNESRLANCSCSKSAVDESVSRTCSKSKLAGSLGDEGVGCVCSKSAPKTSGSKERMCNGCVRSMSKEMESLAYGPNSSTPLKAREETQFRVTLSSSASPRICANERRTDGASSCDAKRKPKYCVTCAVEQTCDQRTKQGARSCEHRRSQDGEAPGGGDCSAGIAGLAREWPSLRLYEDPSANLRALLCRVGGGSHGKVSYRETFYRNLEKFYRRLYEQSLERRLPTCDS